MFFSANCLMSINFASGHELSGDIAQLLEVIAQLSPNDQRPYHAMPASHVGRVMHPLQIIPSPWEIYLPELVTSYNIKRICSRVLKEILHPQRIVNTYFYQTNLMLSNGANDSNNLNIGITIVQAVSGESRTNCWSFLLIIAYQLVEQKVSHNSFNYCIT